jgi:hypothetical protein
MPDLDVLRLATGGPGVVLPGFERVARELPTARVVRIDPGARARGASLEAAAWRAQSIDLWALDRAIDKRAEGGVSLVDLVAPPGDDLPALALEVLTRCQRVLARRNAASATPLFDRVLASHAALYDDPRPLVVADRAHTLDAWQWTLRLDPDASLEVQAAALLHDVDRLGREGDSRTEHRAADYAAEKRAHAERGATIAAAVMRGAGAPASVEERVAALVARHEDAGASDDARLLADADGLGFFSLNAAGYVDYFGLGQARRKIGHTLARLSLGARARVAPLRLRPDVARLVDEVRAQA